MGVINAVFGPYPGGMRRQLHTASGQLLEAPEEHLPGVAIFGRNGPAVCEPLHPRPRQSDLNRPSAIDGIPLIDLPVYVNGRAHAGEVPIEEGPTASSGMRTAPECFWLTVEVTAEGEGFPGANIEFRDIEART